MRNRTLMDMVRSMISYSTLPMSLWMEVVTPLVFSFHICTAFHEHEHHASIRELISHET